MKILKRIFGMAGREPSVAVDSDQVHCFDSTGGEYSIDVEALRQSFPALAERASGNWDELYNLLLLGLQKGFFHEVIDPAHDLIAMEVDQQAATCVLVTALIRLGRLAEAERTLHACMKECGETGELLTNLAKVHATRGEMDTARKFLWQGLRVDPNQENAFDWWGALERERGGAQGFQQAMCDLAELPGSWRAQLWLARAHLEAGDLEGAVAIYKEVLPMATDGPSVLTMVSGDLANSGHLEKGVELVAPLYDASKHDIVAGINLIRMCANCGRVSRGYMILESLERLDRKDIRKHLTALRGELKHAPSAD